MLSNPIPESRRPLLDKPILVHCATIGPNGEPQANPVWFLWDGVHIVIAIGPTGQKARNLGRDPRIALSMVDPDEPLHYLEIRGTIAEIRKVGSADPLVVAMVRKYTGNDTYDGMPDEHALYFIAPERATTM
jgi:PPOX class probable F420-dependent enzyme